MTFQLSLKSTMAEVWNRGMQDYESLEGPERETFNAFTLQVFYIFKELYYQQLERHLDPRLWREVETPMRDVINRFPGIQAWWRRYSDWFSEEFVNYVNQLQQAAKSPSLDRESNPDR